MTPMTSIVLNRPHTHAGKPLKPGNRITVDATTADWLIANGIARHDTPPQGDSATVEHNRPITTKRKESKS